MAGTIAPLVADAGVAAVAPPRLKLRAGVEEAAAPVPDVPKPSAGTDPTAAGLAAGVVARLVKLRAGAGAGVLVMVPKEAGGVELGRASAPKVGAEEVAGVAALPKKPVVAAVVVAGRAAVTAVDVAGAAAEPKLKPEVVADAGVLAPATGNAKDVAEAAGALLAAGSTADPKPGAAAAAVVAPNKLGPLAPLNRLGVLPAAPAAPDAAAPPNRLGAAVDGAEAGAPPNAEELNENPVLPPNPPWAAGAGADDTAGASAVSVDPNTLVVAAADEAPKPAKLGAYEAAGAGAPKGAAPDVKLNVAAGAAAAGAAEAAGAGAPKPVLVAGTAPKALAGVEAAAPRLKPDIAGVLAAAPKAGVEVGAPNAGVELPAPKAAPEPKENAGALLCPPVPNMLLDPKAGAGDVPAAPKAPAVVAPAPCGGVPKLKAPPPPKFMVSNADQDEPMPVLMSKGKVHSHVTH